MILYITVCHPIQLLFFPHYHFLTIPTFFPKSLAWPTNLPTSADTHPRVQKKHSLAAPPPRIQIGLLLAYVCVTEEIAAVCEMKRV